MCTNWEALFLRQDLETINIPECHVSAFEMLFWAFTTTAFSRCSFVGFSTFSFVYV